MIPLLLAPAKVVYRNTITGLRVSAVDGTAFIDNLPYTYSSDFSAGEDGWSETRGTVAGNIDSIGGEDNWLRYTADTELGAHYTRTTPLLTVGRRYIVSVKYYIPSGQTVIAGILFSTGSATFLPAGITYQNTLDAATTYTASFVATNNELRFYATDAAGSVTIQDAGGDDVFYIKDITVSEITPYMDGNHSIEIYDSSNRMLKGVLKASTSAETLGAEINSGTLTALTLYKITATEVNHFGTGLIVGSYFTSAGTETCDANNKVQQVTAGATASTIVSAKGGETYNFSYKNPSFTYNSSSYYCIIRTIR